MFTSNRVSKFIGLLVLTGSILIQPASANEDAKWFVLRYENPVSCWPALLISINGSYRHAFAQKAGGPYDTKAEALKREKELVIKGDCPASG